MSTTSPSRLVIVDAMATSRGVLLSFLPRQNAPETMQTKTAGMEMALILRYEAAGAMSSGSVSIEPRSG